MVAAAKLVPSMTASEFLQWNAPDGAAWQLVDGEPQAMAPANRTHGALQAELGRVLGNHFVASSGRCTVVTAGGIVPNVRSHHNVRIPDLVVTCADYDTEEAVVGDPVLVVEILSLSNRAETWSNVWTYTTIRSVQEILVLHATAIAADLLRRQPDGSWPKEPERIEAGDLTLASIGLTVGLADLYRTTRLARAR